MGLTAEQLEMRRTGIGGSEIAALLGEDEFASPFDVWLSKTQHWVRPQNEDMLRGTFLESGIADWYAHRFGGARLQSCETIRHAAVPIAMCTPDRIVVMPERDRLLSIKAPRRGGDRWGKEGTSDVPPGYLLQLQWEHAVYTSPTPNIWLEPEMHLAALVDGDLRVYVCRADADVQRWLLEYAQAWWARHVVGGEPPSLDGSSEAQRWLRSRFPRDTSPIRPATLWEDLRILALREAEREAERWAGEAETCRLELMQSIGEAGGLKSPAGRITYRADKNGRRNFRTKWTKEK